MFPWLIWLCMAEPLKVPVLSPLPSGDYIRLTGTSHLHWYYGAIRLPTTLLLTSFRCVHIPRFTRFRGRCRLSPVDSIALYSMNRSQTPPWCPLTRLSLADMLPSKKITLLALGFIVVSALNTIPTASLPTLYAQHYCCTHRVVTGDLLGLAGQGFLLLSTLPFAGRTIFQGLEGFHVIIQTGMQVENKKRRKCL